MIETPGTYANDAPTAEGQSFHGDHAYAFYPDPVRRAAAAAGAVARRLPVGAQLGDDLGRSRGLPDAVPAPRLSGLCDRPAASRSGGQQHGGGDRRADALRSALLRPVPPRPLAGLLPRCAGRPAAGDARPVLPLGDAEHRAVRRRRARRRRVGAGRPDRPVRARDPLAGGRSGLADRDREPGRQGRSSRWSRAAASSFPRASSPSRCRARPES